MTTGAGDIATDRDGDFVRSWQALRADQDIQFAPLQPPEAAPPPGWLTAMAEFVGRMLSPVGELIGALGRMIGLSATFLTWAVIAVGVSILIYLGWRLLRQVYARRQVSGEKPVEWTPPPSEALALLEDADVLASQGRFDEAAHMLLLRSVGQISAARPDLLEPSNTAREISRLPALPEAARSAFAIMAEQVEQSLFALRRLTAEDWQAARSAYADFALSGPQGT